MSRSFAPLSARYLNRTTSTEKLGSSTAVSSERERRERVTRDRDQEGNSHICGLERSKPLQVSDLLQGFVPHDKKLNDGHRDTWGEDADEFKPERWLQSLPSSVFEAKTSGVYSSM